MKELLLSFFTFTMSVTPSQFPTINTVDLDGTETIWVQKNGVDYKLSTDNIKQYGGCDVYCTSLVIPTAQVLTLNGTPLTIVSAPPTGYAIEVLSCSAKMVYAGVAYATNGDVWIYTDGATLPQFMFYSTSFLFGTVSRTMRGAEIAATFGVAGATDTQVISAAALKVKVATGNPTAGTSNITISVHYRLISN